MEKVNIYNKQSGIYLQQTVKYVTEYLTIHIRQSLLQLHKKSQITRFDNYNDKKLGGI